MVLEKEELTSDLEDVHFLVPVHQEDGPAPSHGPGLDQEEGRIPGHHIRRIREVGPVVDRILPTLQGQEDPQEEDRILDRLQEGLAENTVDRLQEEKVDRLQEETIEGHDHLKLHLQSKLCMFPISLEM